MKRSTQVRLCKQKRELRETLKAKEKERSRIDRELQRLRQKLQLVENIDEFWDGIPVHIDVNKKKGEGNISVVNEKGHAYTEKYLYISSISNGRGRLRNYILDLREGISPADWFDEVLKLGPMKMSEVWKIVREWITKGTINGKDPKRV